MMKTKLIQEAVTDVASCGVMIEPTTSSLLVGLSFIMLAKAANTANRYAITPMMLAMIKEIFIQTEEVHTENKDVKNTLYSTRPV